ncbi:hypothetical protein F2Q70_00003125 [Brassica cretica]|uniref:Uncharacterized protein n=1 Tax=Brassica cretica TaxID=69181 RepID=A0A8S9J2A7_BRACR|nr:hypothetical protein F2Q70_00003125 [Brassica cretica]
MDEDAVEITLMISGEDCCFSSSTGPTGARGSYITDEGVTFFLMHVVPLSPTYGKTADLTSSDPSTSDYGANSFSPPNNFISHISKYTVLSRWSHLFVL